MNTEIKWGEYQDTQTLIMKVFFLYHKTGNWICKLQIRLRRLNALTAHYWIQLYNSFIFMPCPHVCQLYLMSIRCIHIFVWPVLQAAKIFVNLYKFEFCGKWLKCGPGITLLKIVLSKSIFFKYVSAAQSL